jgi:uncharacterized membrane protein
LFKVSRKCPLLLLSTLLLPGGFRSAFGQVQTPSKKPIAGPPAPQSTHYPILLLALGNNPSWSLRIGQKGPERLDRPNYPPITLEPVDVTRDGAADSWNYRARDTATTAEVTIHLTRESCVDPLSGTKYAFSALVQHAQIGALSGCARIAAELFPKIVNPANQPDEEDDTEKKKPPETTITGFKMPSDIAYLLPPDNPQKMILRRGKIQQTILANGAPSELAFSHDGTRLLYTRESKGSTSIVLYDSATGKSTDLLGDARQAFWSPDDTQLAFLKSVDGHARLYTAPISSPQSATTTYQGDITSIHGWTDTHTVLVDDLQQLLWVTDNGSVQQTLPEKELLGDAFGSSSANTFRVSPINPDLLLVSAEWLRSPKGVPIDERTGGGFGFFLYEIRSKRRVFLSPLTMFSQSAEWSRDSLQIFFTGADSSRHYATWRMFWDGSGLKRYSEGIHLVVGR